jgi:hypothetical protein
MVCTLGNLTADLEFGKTVSYQRLGIVPLRLRKSSALSYLTCDETDLGKWVTIEEVSAAGSVPELRVRNQSNYRLFIFEGSTLIGAKQNRVVNMSIMLGPQSVNVIPVSCVERGRWRVNTPTFGLGAFSDHQLRAKMSAGVTASLKKFGKVTMDQMAVWSHVDSMLGKAQAASPTGAYQAVYDKCHDDLSDYIRQLPAPKEASGVAVEFDGAIQVVDLFDKPETLQKLWPRLVKSYALGSHYSTPRTSQRAPARDFIQRISSTPFDSFQAAGIGVTMRLCSPEGLGSALLCEDQLVHLSLFAESSGLARSGEQSTFVQQPDQGTNRDTGKQPGRPFWRFWD